MLATYVIFFLKMIINLLISKFFFYSYLCPSERSNNWSFENLKLKMWSLFLKKLKRQTTLFFSDWIFSISYKRWADSKNYQLNKEFFPNWLNCFYGNFRKNMFGCVLISTIYFVEGLIFYILYYLNHWIGR